MMDWLTRYLARGILADARVAELERRLHAVESERDYWKMRAEKLTDERLLEVGAVDAAIMHDPGPKRLGRPRGAFNAWGREARLQRPTSPDGLLEVDAVLREALSRRG